MNRFVTRKRIAAFLLFAIALVLLLEVTRHLHRQHLAVLQETQRTQERLSHLREITSGIKDLERSAGWFFATGDEHILQPLYKGKREVTNQLNALRQLTDSTGPYQRKLDSLQRYLFEGVDSLQHLIRHYTTGKRQGRSTARDASMAPYALRRGLVILGDLEAAEQDRLQGQPYIPQQANGIFSRYFFWFSTGLLLLLGCLFTALGYNQVRRRQAEALLSKKASELQAIIDNTSALIYVKDTHGRYILVNKPFEESVHRPGSAIIGKTVYDLYDPEYADTYHRNDQRVIGEKRVIETEEDGLIDGEQQHYYSVKFPLYAADGHVYAVAGISSNITGLLQKKQGEKHRQIAETAIRAQEKERAEIGKELHDNIGQLLTSIKLLLETTLSQPDTWDRYQRKAYQVLLQAMDEVRTLSHALVPPAFHQRNFQQALQELKAQVEGHGTLSIVLVLPDAETLEGLKEEFLLALYRMIQEQVTNTIKHAKATSLRLEMQRIGDRVFLDIADDGVGADPDTLFSGIGLRNIQSRVSYYDGDMQIRTTPGTGFVLHIEMPVPR